MRELGRKANILPLLMHHRSSVFNIVIVLGSGSVCVSVCAVHPGVLEKVCVLCALL